MRPILNQGSIAKFWHSGSFKLKLGAATLMLTGIAAAFGTSPSNVVYQGTFEKVIQGISISTADRIAADIRGITRETRIQRGDTASSLLSRLGVQDEKLANFLNADQKADLFFRQLVPGKPITAELLPDGKMLFLLFPLNGKGDEALQIIRTGDGFVAQIEKLSFDTRVVSQSATIRHSLFGAADEAGIPDDIASRLADIFGGEIDFHRDLRKGDRFSVVYEIADLEGKPARTQRILAAEFLNKDKTHQAFWFQLADGGGGYYTAEGESLRKAFLRSPLEFSRITSGFSKARYHPVLREVRAHRGIDYAAPKGTRVKATGDGVIGFAGVRSGYGKVIFINHGSNKTTVYGHLSNFAPGLHTGKRVSQGDLIGFVGATGIATGPHLHYEFRVDGIHRNPLTIAPPPAAALAPIARLAFKEVVTDLTHQMRLTNDWQLATFD